MVQLRAATTADTPFLEEMLYAAIFVRPGAQIPPRSIVREPAIARYVDGWGTRDGDRGVVAVTGATPVGAAWVRRFPATAPGYGFIDEATPELSMAVRQEHRGHGIGTRLLVSLQEILPAITLSCDPENPARRLYVRAGFLPGPDSRTMVWRRSSP